MLRYLENRYALYRNFSRHPQLATAIAHPALHDIPEMEIPLLLDAAVGDERALHATPEHPLRLIQDWVRDAYPGSGEMVKRRRLLWKAVKAWLLEGKDSRVGFTALRAVLTPEYERRSLDPGKGMKVTIHFGGPAESDITTIQMLWPTIMSVIEILKTVEWRELCGSVEDWAYPGRINTHLSDEVRLMMKSFAGQMLRDVSGIAAGHPGVLHWVDSVAQHLALEIRIPLEPTFEILYPQRESEDWQAAAERQANAVRELARSWASGSPNHAVSTIIEMENEARLANINWPRWTPLLCEEIAATTSSLCAWAQALIEHQASPDLVEPFLRASAAENESEWPELAKACLLDPRLRPAAISVLLTMSDPPAGLLSAALKNLEGYSQMIDVLCLRAQVPPGTLRLLLRHEDATIAGSAALGAWHAREKVPIDESLRSDWCRAITGTTVDDYWLAQVLGHEPGLAHDWLEARLAEDFQQSYRHDSALKAAIAALNLEQRSTILAELPVKFGCEGVVLQLIGDNLDLYRQLLGNQRLKQFHMIPLAGYPEGTWISKARLALDAGYCPDDIAHAAVWANPERVSFWGSEAAVWSEWLVRFQRLYERDDDDIRAIGRAGKTQVSVWRDDALERERQEAVYGIDQQ